MNKSLVIAAIAGCLFGSLPALADGCGAKAVQPAAESKAQTHCPVMGAAVNKDIYVDHGGKRVYLCCRACVSMFKADPEKYLQKLADEGVQVEDAPSAP